MSASHSFSFDDMCEQSLIKYFFLYQNHEMVRIYIYQRPFIFPVDIYFFTLTFKNILLGKRKGITEFLYIYRAQFIPLAAYFNA